MRKFESASSLYLEVSWMLSVFLRTYKGSKSYILVHSWLLFLEIGIGEKIVIDIWFLLQIILCDCENEKEKDTSVSWTWHCYLVKIAC